ncbi:MAG: ubiquinone biosynthesis protein UbiB, partial [Betaproteobacteria bacterium HGW-Betaproteobacteria-13]
LPQDLRQLLRASRTGRLKVQVEVVPLKQFGERLDRAISRLALSIVTAALIIGSAIILTVDNDAALPGGLSFGWLGFGAAVLGGVWVLISIWRSGGRH